MFDNTNIKEDSNDILFEVCMMIKKEFERPNIM